METEKELIELIKSIISSIEWKSCHMEREPENVAKNNISEDDAEDSAYIELIDVDGAEYSLEGCKRAVLSAVKGNPLLERTVNDAQNALSLVALINLIGVGTATLVKRKDNALAIYEDATNSLKKIVVGYIERGEYRYAKSPLNDLDYWESRKDEMLDAIRKGAAYLERNLPTFYSLVDDSLF